MTKRKTTAVKSTDLPLCKVCDLADFDQPALRTELQDMYPGLFEPVVVYDDDGEGMVTEETAIPVGRRRRKFWETAMAVAALRCQGAIREDARLLGVGAGREWTGFYLTRYVGEVIMTDLYADTKKPWQNAPLEMLINPQPLGAGEWNPQRLITQHMDATALRYPDNTFDGVFSSSAIEHYGSPEQIAKAAAEMGRVLKPGGVLTLATEFKLDGDGNGWPGVYLFDDVTIQDLIVQPSGCQLVGTFETAISQATRDTMMTLSKASTLAKDYSRPHIVFANKGQIFTSAFLTLVKPSE